MRRLLRSLLTLLVAAAFVAVGTGASEARDGKVTMPSGVILEITDLDLSMISLGGPRQPGEKRKPRRRIVEAVIAVTSRGDDRASEAEISDELIVYVVGDFAQQAKSRFVTVTVTPGGPPKPGESWIEETVYRYEKLAENQWINKQTKKKVEIRVQD